MVKQARAHITREAIIRAAGTVFSKMTYSTATLADVIGEAGVTQGALYFHFDSKRDLALEVIMRQHETSLRAGQALFATDTSGIEAMVMLSSELANQITTDPIVRGGLRLSTESADLFDEHASRPYLDWIAACEEFLRRAVDDGDIAVDSDVPVLARFVISAFTGVQVVSLATNGWTDLYERLEQMWRIVLRAIVVPERLPEVERWAEMSRPVNRVETASDG